MAIANLDQLFQSITGYAVPRTQPSSFPQVFMDEMSHIGASEAPADFVEVADIAAGAIDAIADLFEAPSMRELIDLCEFFQSKPIMVGNVAFDRTASQKARQRFQADIAIARQLYSKVGQGDLVEGRIHLADMTKIKTGTILAGQYVVKDDATMVSLSHGLRNGRYTACLVHELAHRFHYLHAAKKAPNSQATLDQHVQAFFAWAEDNPEVFPSRYAQQDHYEFFAESVTHLLMDEKLDPRVKLWTEATLRAFR